ncbi:MAG: SpoIID/LytB domain-containing protein [Gemmatimonadota bacterium]
MKIRLPRLLAVLPFGVAALLASCATPESRVVVGPRGAQPDIRVGLAVGVSQVVIGGGGALAVLGADTTVRAEVPAGSSLTIVERGGGLGVSGALSWFLPAGEPLSVAPIGADGFVRVAGKDYRGRVSVFSARGALTVVNQLGLENYLAGVVSAEMGRRDSSEVQALYAQAVISRTYALRNRRRWDAVGFDFYATVADQVYGGVSAERPQGWEAVNGTAGMAVTWQGQPIDGFFFSTCGGKTANGTEVFANADRPYLVSIDDIDENGVAYCRISPRYEWRAEWSVEALRDILRESVPATLGASISSHAVIQSVEVVERSRSDRVARLTLTIDGREIAVNGAAVRQVLRPARGELLRSSVFTLSQNRNAGRVVRLVAEGRGAGHGVGFCQWGAVGRARAGQGYRQILAAYFPDTDLERIY